MRLALTEVEESLVDFLSTREDVTNVRKEIVESKSVISQHIWDVKVDLSGKISKTNERISETNERISSVETKLTEKISSVETNLTSEIAKTNERISDVRTELKEDIAKVGFDQKKQFKWFVGIMVTLFGVMMSTTIYMLTNIP